MSESKKFSLPMIGTMDRRTALKAGAVTLGITAWAAAIKPWFEWTAELDVDSFLQNHYRELTAEQKQAVFRRLEEDAKKQYGADVHISDPLPLPGVQYAYALNLSICIGCRKCAEACHVENNHDRPTHESYIRVFEMQKGGIDFAKGDCHYDHPVPAPDRYYMPVQCQHCENAPCVKACPEALTRFTQAQAEGLRVNDEL